MICDKPQIEFYRNALGHRVLWRRETAVGLSMPETDAEIVLNSNLPQETDLLVESTKVAFEILIKNGCKPLRPPFEIDIGWCAIVLDPFGNQLGFLDLSKVQKK